MTNCVQSKVLESKAKQVHFQQDLKSSNLNVEAWLLARKSLAGSEYTDNVPQTSNLQ